MNNYWDGEDGGTPGYPDQPAPVQTPPPVAATPGPTPDDPYPGHQIDPGTGQWVPIDAANPGPTMGPYPGYSPTSGTPGYPGGSNTNTATPPTPTGGGGGGDTGGMWEAYLKAALGSLYSPTTLQSVLANISYAQNAGKDPKQIVDAIIAKEKLRLGNASGSTYTPDGKGGFLTGPGTMAGFGSNFPSYFGGGASGGAPGSMSAFGTSYAGGSAPFTPSVGAFPSDLLQPWDKTFTPPDAATIKDSPLVQSRINLGLDTMQKGAAGKGTLLTPGFQKSIADYAGDVGSQEYWNLYNSAAQEYQNAYSMFEGDKSRRANTWLGVGNFDFGALMGLTQMGQNQQGLDENQRMDTFGMNRANTMDAFNVYNTQDVNYYERLFRAAQLGQPQ